MSVTALAPGRSRGTRLVERELANRASWTPARPVPFNPIAVPILVWALTRTGDPGFPEPLAPALPEFNLLPSHLNYTPKQMQKKLKKYILEML